MECWGTARDRMGMQFAIMIQIMQRVTEWREFEDETFLLWENCLLFHGLLLTFHRMEIQGFNFLKFNLHLPKFQCHPSTKKIPLLIPKVSPRQALQLSQNLRVWFVASYWFICFHNSLSTYLRSHLVMAFGFQI